MIDREKLLGKAKEKAAEREKDRLYKLDIERIRDLEKEDEIELLLDSISGHKNVYAAHVQETPRKAIAGIVKHARKRILIEIGYVLNPIINNQASFNMKVSESLDAIFKRFTKRMDAIERSLSDIGYGQKSRERENIERFDALQDDFEKSIAELSEDLRIQIGDLKKNVANIAAQTRRDGDDQREPDYYLEMSAKDMLDSGEQKRAREDPDYEYHLFEKHFYETESVKKKQKKYLDYIQDTGSPVLDLGCGRGEFIRLLKKRGFDCIGVDINPHQVQELRDDGFEVEVSGLLEHLKKTKRRFSAITAFQVVEHLDHQEIKEMISLAHSKLGNGGVLILETINPLSPLAMSSYYKDPTHRTPLPPDLLRFIMEVRGFGDIKILYSNPVAKEHRLGDTFSDYHDYALIGHKDGKKD